MKGINCVCLLVCITGCEKNIERSNHETRFQKSKKYMRLRIQIEKNGSGKDERDSFSRDKGAKK